MSECSRAAPDWWLKERGKPVPKGQHVREGDLVLFSSPNLLSSGFKYGGGRGNHGVDFDNPAPEQYILVRWS